jgi:hypothetical protein
MLRNESRGICIKLPASKALTLIVLWMIGKPNKIKSFKSFVNFYLYTSIKKEFKMDIQSLKLNLVEKIIQTDKPSLLVKIGELFQSETTDDWWDKLPEEVQDSILKGVTDIEEGKHFSHEQVIQEAKQKYGF